VAHAQSLGLDQNRLNCDICLPRIDLRVAHA
jgi:hypothetical protein